MRTNDFVPPLGWVAALTSAAVTALWLQGTPPDLATSSGDLSSQLQSGAQDKNTLRLPPPTNAESALELFATRPLLAEGRRPFTPEQVAATSELEPEVAPPPEEPQGTPLVAPDPPQVMMLGTVEANGERRVLFRDDTSGTETWYRARDTVAGWTIVEILPDRTRLQLQDAEITFNLFGE